MLFKSKIVLKFSNRNVKQVSNIFLSHICNAWFLRHHYLKRHMFGVMVLLKLTYNTQTNAKENYLTMEQIVVKTNIYHHENLLYELNCKERRM